MALTLLAGAGLFVLSSGTQAQEQIGTSAAVRGDVFVTPVATSSRRSVEPSQSFFLQDRIETLRDSVLQILLLDRSVFTVGENANLVIDRFVYDPSTNAGDTAATITQGVFRFLSGNVNATGTAAIINTPAATIGIRGTYLEGVAGPQAAQLASMAGLGGTACSDPGRSLFVVMRGAGRANSSFANKSGLITISNSRGQRELSESNWAVFVPGPNCSIEGPIKYGGGLRAALDGVLRPVPGSSASTTTNQGSQGAQLSGQARFNLPADILPDTPRFIASDTSPSNQPSSVSTPSASTPSASTPPASTPPASTPASTPGAILGL